MRTEYVPGMRTTLAAADLPDGRNYYRAKIREFTTLDMDPEEIHRLGVAEVGRLHEAMLATMRETGFSGDFAAFLKFLRTDPRFYARSPEELLMRAAWIAKRFDGKAGQFFGYLPRARFAIKPVPEDLAAFYTAGRGGPGVYLLNTYDLPSRPLYNLTALTLHESAPGHAFQMPIAMEHKDQPMFRQLTYISAYGEGEALSRAEKALGDRFNVRAFHDAVLELGSVPLPVLETQIDRFIAGGGRGPYPDME